MFELTRPAVRRLSNNVFRADWPPCEIALPVAKKGCQKTFVYLSYNHILHRGTLRGAGELYKISHLKQRRDTHGEGGHKSKRPSGCWLGLAAATYSRAERLGPLRIQSL